MTVISQDQVSDEQLRQQVADLVVRAAGAGVLTLKQADEAMTDVYRARTAGELGGVIDRHVPAPWLAEHMVAEREMAGRRAARASFHRHLGTYLAGMLLMVGIWLAVGLAAGAWYPWPVWPALGWGIGVVSHAREARGGPRRSGGCGQRRLAAAG